MIELKNQVFEYLKNGDVNAILEIADNFSKLSSLSEFYDYMLKPILYEIGNLWAVNRLDISIKH
jgi:MerR family transcriptional regulator, light-induced transcriptional regulator